jgi:hypothetical protein
MAEFDPLSLETGRNLGLQRRRRWSWATSHCLGSPESLAREAGVSGSEPRRASDTPLFLMRVALTEWEERLARTFLVLGALAAVAVGWWWAIATASW